MLPVANFQTSQQRPTGLFDQLENSNIRARHPHDRLIPVATNRQLNTHIITHNIRSNINHLSATSPLLSPPPPALVPPSHRTDPRPASQYATTGAVGQSRAHQPLAESCKGRRPPAVFPNMRFITRLTFLAGVFLVGYFGARCCTPLSDALPAFERERFSTGTTDVYVYFCAPAGQFDDSYMQDEVAKIDTAVSDYFRRQSSNLASVRFVLGGVVSPPGVDWANSTISQWSDAEAPHDLAPCEDPLPRAPRCSCSGRRRSRRQCGGFRSPERWPRRYVNISQAFQPTPLRTLSLRHCP